jgi:hypothetical protein
MRRDGSDQEALLVRQGGQVTGRFGGRERVQNPDVLQRGCGRRGGCARQGGSKQGGSKEKGA